MIVSYCRILPHIVSYCLISHVVSYRLILSHTANNNTTNNNNNNNKQQQVTPTSTTNNNSNCSFLPHKSLILTQRANNMRANRSENSPLKAQDVKITIYFHEITFAAPATAATTRRTRVRTGPQQQQH